MHTQNITQTQNTGQYQNDNAKESKKYIDNYIYASTISCFTVLILFFILFEFQDFFSNENLDDSKSKNEIMFLLDVSNSMNANDISMAEIEFSRLNAAKKCINSILENTNNSDFGLVIFAGQAETIIPISKDRIWTKQLLEGIETNFITNQGTNIELAIDEAIQCFSDIQDSNNIQYFSNIQFSNDVKNKNVKNKSASNKTIILLSDVENHNGNIENALLNLKAKNISIEAIGFGSESGSKIPINDNEFLKEFNGRDVITSLNPTVLRNISENYYIYPFDLNLLLERIDVATKNSSNFFVLSSTFMTLNLLLLLVFLSIWVSIFFKQQTI